MEIKLSKRCTLLTIFFKQFQNKTNFFNKTSTNKVEILLTRQNYPTEKHFVKKRIASELTLPSALAFCRYMQLIVSL